MGCEEDDDLVRLEHGNTKSAGAYLTTKKVLADHWSGEDSLCLEIISQCFSSVMLLLSSSHKMGIMIERKSRNTLNTSWTHCAWQSLNGS